MFEFVSKRYSGQAEAQCWQEAIINQLNNLEFVSTRLLERRNHSGDLMNDKKIRENYCLDCSTEKCQPLIDLKPIQLDASMVRSNEEEFAANDCEVRFSAGDLASVENWSGWFTGSCKRSLITDFTLLTPNVVTQWWCEHLTLWTWNHSESAVWRRITHRGRFQASEDQKNNDDKLPLDLHDRLSDYLDFNRNGTLWVSLKPRFLISDQQFDFFKAVLPFTT